MDRMGKILVTGASGRIGRHLIEALVRDGHQVRAVASGRQDAALPRHARIEWVAHDFARCDPFDDCLRDCHAVFHLAAEIWRIPLIRPVNVDATAALARAARRAGVRFFCFTSSAAAYCSPRGRLVTEDSPRLTPDRDIRSEYRGNASIRAYGRSKVMAEDIVATELDGTARVIFRPTMVVDLPQIRALAGRSALQRFALAGRHEHLIYVGDVVDALIWSMRRANAAGLSVFNLSDDGAEVGRAAALFRRLAERTGRRSVADRVSAPYVVYDLLDMAKNRMLSARRPFGGVVFSDARLRAAGYAPRVGLARAVDMAFPPMAA
jgi:nucleoside-diphosphate-sugar epimerase